MTVGESTETPHQNSTSSPDSSELNIEIVHQNSQNQTNNNTLKPARMGRRKQIAPQKAAGTDGKECNVHIHALYGFYAVSHVFIVPRIFLAVFLHHHFLSNKTFALNLLRILKRSKGTLPIVTNILPCFLRVTSTGKMQLTFSLVRGPEKLKLSRKEKYTLFVRIYI